MIDYCKSLQLPLLLVQDAYAIILWFADLTSMVQKGKKNIYKNAALLGRMPLLMLLKFAASWSAFY